MIVTRQWFDGIARLEFNGVVFFFSHDCKAFSHWRAYHTLLLVFVVVIPFGPRNGRLMQAEGEEGLRKVEQFIGEDLRIAFDHLAEKTIAILPRPLQFSPFPRTITTSNIKLFFLKKKIINNS